MFLCDTHYVLQQVFSRHFTTSKYIPQTTTQSVGNHIHCTFVSTSLTLLSAHLFFNVFVFCFCFLGKHVLFWPFQPKETWPNHFWTHTQGCVLFLEPSNHQTQLKWIVKLHPIYSQHNIYLWHTDSIWSLLCTHHTSSHRPIPGLTSSSLTPPPGSHSLWKCKI